jgi:hypothetical protein
MGRRRGKMTKLTKLRGLGWCKIGVERLESY